MNAAALLLLCGCAQVAQAAVQVSTTWNLTGADPVALSQPALESGLRTMYDNAGLPYAGYSVDSLSGALAPAPPSASPPPAPPPSTAPPSTAPAPRPTPPPPPAPSDSSGAPDTAMILVVTLSAVGVLLLAAALLCYIPSPPPRRSRAQYAPTEYAPQPYAQSQYGGEPQQRALKPLPYFS